MGTRASARSVIAAALVAGVVTLFPGVAAAAQQPPPWFHASDPACTTAYYAGYTISSTSPPVASRTQGTYGPVTLTRSSNAPDSCFDWEGQDLNPSVPGVDTFGWPATWDAGGIKLQRSDPFTSCPTTATTCNYFVLAGSAGNFWFFAGTPSTDPNQPGPDPNSFNNGDVALAPPGDIHFGTVNAVPTADPNGGPGKITINAAGTTDDAGQALTFNWVLTSASGKSYTGSSTAPDGTFEWTVDEDGSYCAQLTVTAGDGYSKSSAACSGGAGGDYVFNVTGVAPKDPGPDPDPDPDPTPTPTPTPKPKPSPNPGGAPEPGSGVFFSRPSRAPATLSGSGTKPTIVWLWRPEWYQPGRESEPETAEQPKLKGRRDIVVSTGPEGANAGPWLAGLSAFGLLGGGFLLSRRRRMRAFADF